MRSKSTRERTIDDIFVYQYISILFLYNVLRLSLYIIHTIRYTVHVMKNTLMYYVIVYVTSYIY